ncbi:MAG: hypothetical protein IIB45_00650 [Candidatus Marinimicrobia bacterium]|nr:hypothetical protein [Candidatus Neomarinimicrobiota bacterium]
MATCLGYRYGTGCSHRSRCTQKRENWENWQLCYSCARKLHPEFYKDKKSKSLSHKNLNIGNQTADLVNECAERIYEIRCRVVHTKASDKNYELLLPSSPELKYLVHDITILEMIAKKVMVSTSRLLKI